MEISFLHIGMMKTATTSMQSVWFNDPAYCLSRQGTFPLLEILRTAAKKGTIDPKTKVNINTDKPFKQGQKIIVSNEGFSTAFLNLSAVQKKLPDFINLSSNSLSNLLPNCNNLLFVVREPLSWIKSIYIQSIKEGGYGDCQKFVDEQEEFLFHSLDIRHIINCYKRYFNNILILPFEMLKEDNKNSFWKCIHKKFDVPVPQIELPRTNISFGSDQVYLLSTFNRFSAMLLKTLSASKTYTSQQEKQSISQRYRESGMWVHRRFIEHASMRDIEQVKQHFRLGPLPKNLFGFSISDRLRDKIKNDFIHFLREDKWLDDNYVDSYEKNLDST